MDQRTIVFESELIWAIMQIREVLTLQDLWTGHEIVHSSTEKIIEPKWIIGLYIMTLPHMNTKYHVTPLIVPIDASFPSYYYYIPIKFAAAKRKL